MSNLTSITAALLNKSGTFVFNGDDDNVSVAARPGAAPMAQFLYLVVTPTIGVGGMIATVVSLCVFGTRVHSNRRLGRDIPSLTVLLMGLCVYDLLLLWSCMCLFVLLGWCERNLNTVACSIFDSYFLYILPPSQMFQFGSVYLCVAIAVDRFVAVTFPLQRRRWCTVKRTVLIILIITGIAVVYRIPTVITTFELQFDEVTGKQIIANHTLGSTYWYQTIYNFYMQLTIVFLFPWMIMIVLNVSVWYQIKRSNKKWATARANGCKQDEKSVTSRRRSENRRTLLAMLVVVTFVVFNFPAQLTSIFEKYFDDPPWILVWVPLSNVCIMVNSATNFAIYCAIDKHFRTQFVYFLCPFCCRVDRTGLDGQTREPGTFTMAHRSTLPSTHQSTFRAQSGDKATAIHNNMSVGSAACLQRARNSSVYLTGALNQQQLLHARTQSACGWQAGGDENTAAPARVHLRPEPQPQQQQQQQQQQHPHQEKSHYRAMIQQGQKQMNPDGDPSVLPALNTSDIDYSSVDKLTVCFEKQ